MKSMLKRLFATALVAALALTALTACSDSLIDELRYALGGSGWWISVSDAVHQGLRKQGSSLTLETDWGGLGKIAETSEADILSVWDKYGWDGTSAKSAAMQKEEKAAAAKHGFDSSSQLLIIEKSVSGSSGGYKTEAAAVASQISSAGNTYTKLGYTFVKYKNMNYLVCIAG